MDMNQLLRALGLQQAYQAYQQNIGEPFAAVVGGAGRGYLGLDKPEYGGLLAEESYRTGQAMGNMPAVGAPAGAFKAAAQAPGLLSDAAQFLRNLSPEQMGLLGITAFHGSPHRFSKFDASKIGTGEGAQAYGHGLYFAESPDVAKGYREALSNNVTVDGKKLQTIPSDSPIAQAQNNVITAMTQQKMSPQDAIAHTVKYWNDAADEMAAFVKTNPELADRINKEVVSRREIAKSASLLKPESFYKDPGAFYTVDIPDEMISRMLDYDAPLKDQPEVLKAIRNAIIDDPDIRKSFEFNVEKGISGANAMSNYIGGSAGEIAQKLRGVGIPGVRYLDQGSRGMGRGTKNFVVFPGEEEAIKMLSVD
jgi:hypothetical protein